MSKGLYTNNLEGTLELASYGSNNDLFIDKLCAFILAISPLLQHYKGIYQNAGFTLLLIIFPYIMVKLFLKIKYSSINTRCLYAILPLVLFQLFRMSVHESSLTKMAYGVFFILLFLAVAFECINIKAFVESATFICCLAGAFLLLQYILFYGFSYHLQLVPTSMLLPESSSWILGAQTGLIAVTGEPNGFYRPSAFFLEPSHLFIYSFPILCILLLSPNMSDRKFKMAILITIGMILSTSGMGIAVCIGVWGLYYALYNNGKDKRNVASVSNIFTLRNAILLIILIIVLIIMYFKVDFFGNSIDRIFGIGNDIEQRSTAISGRTARASTLIEGMSGGSLLFGLTEDVSNIEFNLPGFYGTLYKFGIIGVVLSYGYYLGGLLKLKGQYFWISFLIILISFFTAHTHGTFYMMYYVIILMDGYYRAYEPTYGKINRFFGIKRYKVGGRIERTERCT